MEDIITQAAKYLEKGEVISFPTETVYALSVNACNDKAVNEIYRLKGRKKDNPLALLVGSISQAQAIVEFNETAQMLAEKYFPGPLTLILPKKRNVNISLFINEGLETLAVRMPNHETALAILNACKFPVIGTSANPSGLTPAGSAAEVRAYFSNLPLILENNQPIANIASTIVDLSGEKPKLVRQGEIILDF